MHEVIKAPAVPEVAELEYGTFHDDRFKYAIRAATTDPGVVRVHCLNGGPALYWVVVLTEVRTPRVNAIWGNAWAQRGSTWKRLCLEWAFRSYFCNRPTVRRRHSRSRPIPAATP